MEVGGLRAMRSVPRRKEGPRANVVRIDGCVLDVARYVAVLDDHLYDRTSKDCSICCQRNASHALLA